VIINARKARRYHCHGFVKKCASASLNVKLRDACNESVAQLRERTGEVSPRRLEATPEAGGFSPNMNARNYLTPEGRPYRRGKSSVSGGREFTIHVIYQSRAKADYVHPRPLSPAQSRLPPRVLLFQKHFSSSFSPLAPFFFPVRSRFLSFISAEIPRRGRDTRAAFDSRPRQLSGRASLPKLNQLGGCVFCRAIYDIIDDDGDDDGDEGDSGAIRR